MVSVINQCGAWYAVYHFGDHVRSDLTNVISSYMFRDKASAELFADAVLKQYEKNKEAE